MTPPGDPAPIAWLDDVGVGSWIPEAQLHQHGRVGALVPAVFDSYAYLRPAGELRDVINPAQELREHLVSRLASHAADVAHCLFAVSDVYGWDGSTTSGAADLVFERPIRDEREAEQLLRRLQEEASPAASRSGSSAPPLLETRIRSYMLFAGSLHDAGAVARAGGPTEIPDLWWPTSRSWFVATDTDLDGVVVAGTQELTMALAGRGVHVEPVTPSSYLG